MSTVQEIVGALSRLSPEELNSVEQWIHENRLADATSDYPMADYGLTEEEMERFDERMRREIEEDRKDGEIRRFTRNLSADLVD